MSEQDGTVLQPEHADSRARQRKNAHDNLLHAGEFTKSENLPALGIVRGWIPEKFRQDDEVIKASNDLWALGTLAEHFLSELDSDPNTRTRESRAVLLELQRIVGAADARLRELTPDDDDADDIDRINELTDRTVREVLEKLGL
jgi:hypothetical protein